MGTGQSAASHEGVELKPYPNDNEIVTLTRRDLRIIVNTLLKIKLKDHVRLETVQL